MKIERSYEYGDIRSEYCPYCGSEDFDSADWCNNCHSNIKKADTMLCDKCYDRLTQSFGRFLCSLSTIELDVLDEMLDGESVRKYYEVKK